MQDDTSPSPAQPPDELEAICERFESAWQRGERPAIEDLLPDDPELRLRALVELVNIELELRLQSGEAAQCENYFARFPELAVDRTEAIAIVALEFQHRKRRDPALAVAEFVRRFPQFAPELEQRLTAPPAPRRRPRALRLNCPHCHNPIQIVDDSPSEEMVCPSCGSSFHLDRDRTTSWSPERLPKVGKFELLETVGRGAFGTVYRAKDTELDRIVAVKVPRSGSFATKEDEDRFVREGRSVAQLRHPGIVPIYEVGCSGVFPYLASEFVDGLTLSDAMSGRRFSFRESAEIVAQAAEALDHAHQLGVVHRDVKPSNLMVVLPKRGSEANSPTTGGRSSSDTRVAGAGPKGSPGDVTGGRGSTEGKFRTSGGRGSTSAARGDQPTLIVRVMDFGLARRDEGEITMTLDGQVLGTPAYMSPEQARGEGHRVGGSSDVYSLGVILYQLLTGEPPFRGNNRMLLHQVLNDEPRAPRTLNDRVPKDMETIALKCLQKDPAKRYTTAADLSADLRRWQRGEPILARHITRVARSWRWCRRNPMIAAFAVGFFLSLSAGVIVSTWLAVSATDAKNDALVAEGKAIRLADEKGKLAQTEVAQRGIIERQADYLTRELYELGASELTHGNVERGMLILASAYKSAGETSPIRSSIRRLLSYSAERVIVVLSHNGANSVAFSPDGSMVLTGSWNREDKTARLWDARTGRPLAEPMRHEGPINNLAFSPDGTTILTASGYTAQLWDARSGRRVGEPMEHEDAVYAVAFSPDGARVLTGCRVFPHYKFKPSPAERPKEFETGSARLWDAHTGKPLGEPMKHESPVTAVEFSPDGAVIMTLSQLAKSDTEKDKRMDGMGIFPFGIAQLWDARTCKPIGEKMKHDAPINAVAFSRNGATLVTGSVDGTARRWDVQTGKQIGEPMRNDGAVTAVAIRTAQIQADRERIVIGGSNFMRRWDTDGSSTVTWFMNSEGFGYCRAFSPDCTAVLTTTADSARLWNTDSAMPLGEPMRHDDPILNAAFSPDGAIVLTTCRDGRVRLWNARTETPRVSPSRVEESGRCLAFSPGGATMVTANNDIARLWDTRTGKLLGKPIRNNDRISFAAFSADGATVLIASEILTPTIAGGFNTVPGQIRICDARTGKALEEPMIRKEIGYPLALGPNGAMLFGNNNVRNARIVDVHTGKKIVELMTDWDRIEAAAFGADGAILLTGGYDGKARLWNTRTGKQIGEPIKHDGRILAVALSPGGTLALTASEDGTARVWDVQTGKALAEPMKHQRPISTVAFSPDGATVLTGSDDGTARLWDARTSIPLAEPMKHDSGVGAVAVSADGATILTGSSDGSVRRWPIPPLIPDKLIPLIVATRTSLKFAETGQIERLSEAELAATWKQLDADGRGWLAEKAKFEQNQTNGWHRHEADEAESRDNWLAAEFHLRWLLKNMPDDADLRSRHERAVQRLGEQKSADDREQKRADDRKPKSDDDRKALSSMFQQAAAHWKSGQTDKALSLAGEIIRRSQLPPLDLAQRTRSAAGLQFNKWSYPADENGLRGYFEKKGSVWVEVKNEELFGVFEERDRTSEHVELYDPARRLWVRLTSSQTEYSWDKTKWLNPYRGAPVDDSRPK